MELLNLGGSDESAAPKRSLGRFKKMGLGLALVAVAATVSTTLAGAININNGTNGTGSVTFGQGVATTASCDDNINVSPTSVFNSNYNNFWIKDITVSDIAASCLDKRLTITMYDGSGNRLNEPFPIYYVSASNPNNPFPGDDVFLASSNYNGHSWALDPGMINNITTGSNSGGTNGLDIANNGGENSFSIKDLNRRCFDDNGYNPYSSSLTRITVEASDIPSATNFFDFNFNTTNDTCNWWARQHSAPVKP